MKTPREAAAAYCPKGTAPSLLGLVEEAIRKDREARAGHELGAALSTLSQLQSQGRLMVRANVLANVQGVVEAAIRELGVQQGPIAMPRKAPRGSGVAIGQRGGKTAALTAAANAARAQGQRVRVVDAQRSDADEIPHSWCGHRPVCTSHDEHVRRGQR